MKAYIIANVSVAALNVFLTLMLFFTGKSTSPRRDICAVLFALSWIAWGIYLLATSR